MAEDISLNEIFNAVIAKVTNAKTPFVSTPKMLISQVYRELYGDSVTMQISLCADIFDLLKRSEHIGISITQVNESDEYSPLNREYVWSSKHKNK